MTAWAMASKATNLAAVSPAALKLIGLLDQPDIANEDVVEVLKYDTVLTAKLLRVCNSPSLGFVETVGSVDQAVLLLGYKQILHFVLALALGDALAVPMAGYAVAENELWRHSLMVAVAAETLCRQEPGLNADPATAFTAGLLHDIGKIAMNQALTAECQMAVRYRIAEHAASRVEAERAVLGTDHAEVGGYLLSLWRLPEGIVEGVANHHAPLVEPRGRLSVVVYLANCLAHLAGSAPGWEAYALKTDSRVAGALELTPEKLEGLVLQVRESCEQAQPLGAKE
jgi:putative nucleotidyltransferase with HDIG domain